ncbi:MAG: hypothetical protein VX435_15215 [Planctomycetota bacterium]|nr:hypothetical protein [Planctomycetota bacterium]
MPSDEKVTGSPKEPEEGSPSEEQGVEEESAQPEQGSPKITGVIGDAREIQLGSNSGVGKVRKKKLSLSVKKPQKKSWFHVHPSKDYRGSFRAVEMDSEDSFEVKWYIIAPALHHDFKLSEDTVDIHVYTYLTNKGRVGLWPLKINDGDWCSTALEAIGYAQEQIIRLIPDNVSRCYSIEEAIQEPPAPDWERVLEGKTFTELLNLGFKGRYVEDEDHELFEDLWMKHKRETD